MVDALPEVLFAAWAVRVEGGEALDCADLLRAHPAHAAELRRLHDDWLFFAPLLGRVVPGLLASRAGIVVAPLSGDDQDAPELAASELLERLRIHVPNSGRYRFRAVIGRGGGGVVLKVWDTKLNRPLAMKVVLGRGEDRPLGDTPEVDGRSLARFVDEARIASQLDHPGIVPVHELGADEAGRAFFTMKLVKGEDLALVLEHVATGRDGWNQTRALGVLLRVCEAMSYAHAKRVIHRDLKPANVMVGPYGEVYVMDWGLARVIGEPDPHDLRIRPPAPGPARSVESVRRPDGESTPHSPLMTLDGTVVGTPAYMPPEQARGEIEKLSARSDVYSVGAMLYHLLARQSPYASPGQRLTNQNVLARVLQGPPAPLVTLRRDVPAELAAICEKAMARESERRYADMAELAGDLRAYLEHRVVKAHQTGARAEFMKWVARHRELALASVAALLIALGGLGWVLLVQTAARRDIGVALSEARALALANASKAAESVDPIRALLLAREAARVQMLPAAESQLHSALVGSLEEVVFLGHTARLAPAVFSQSDDRVLTASGDRTAQIWKLDGSVIATFVGHERSLRAALFSPAGDRVLTASEDGTARLWGLDGRELRRLEGHTDAVDALAYSPKGDRIVTGSSDGTARLWDGDGIPLRVLSGHTQRITSVAWSPKGDCFVTASDDGDVRVWDAAGAPLAVLAHRSPVSALAFSPLDGHLLLTGTEDGVTRLWDIATAHPTTIGLRTRPVCSGAFAPREDVFAVAAGRSVSLWNTQDALAGREQPFAELLGHTDDICCTVFSPDGQMVATAGSGDATARVWDLQGRSIAVLRGHAGSVCSVGFAHDFTPERGLLLTASADGTARTWRLKGAEIATYRSVKYGMHALAVCGCGKRRVLAVPDEGPAVLLDQNGTKINEYGEAADRLRSARFSLDVKRVVTADERGWVSVFALMGKSPLFTFDTHGPGCSADFSPLGTLILTWSDDSTAKLWDLAGHFVREFDEHEDRVRCAAFSLDGHWIVTGSRDCRARIWDADTGELRRTLEGHGRTVTSAVFSHDGRRVLTAGGADQTARIWDLEGHPLHCWLHASSVNVAAFSNDDSLVAVGCGDGSTWLWDVAKDRFLAQMPGHSAGVIAAEFEQDDASLATACADGNVRVRSTRAADVYARVEHKISRNFTHAEIVQYQALLDHRYDALLAAYRYLEPKLAAAVVVEDVRAQVRDDPLLREDVRAAALLVLARTYDDPQRVRTGTWEVVRRSGLSGDEYHHALGCAIIADDISHENLFARVLLGLAQHRAGREDEALRTLEEVDPKIGEKDAGTQLTCIGALALVQHALGRDDQAREALARFDGISSTLTEPVPFRFRVFLDEARELERQIGPEPR
jgi:WD40 repeat protein/serine/threonine protein kinase